MTLASSASKTMKPRPAHQVFVAVFVRLPALYLTLADKMSAGTVALEYAPWTFFRMDIVQLKTSHPASVEMQALTLLSVRQGPM